MPANQVSSPSTPPREADSSREKRIATVAWRWNRQYRYDAEYKARGFSDQEIREGDALGQAMQDEYSKNRRCYGDPAYGSWPAHAEQPIKDQVRAMLRGASEPTAPPVVTAAPAVVLTSLAYSMVARVAKARTLAHVLHQGGLPSSEVDRMTPCMWKQFHAGLRAKGLLGPHSTPPSQETIARAIAELRKLERLIPECGAARASRLPEAA